MNIEEIPMRNTKENKRINNMGTLHIFAALLVMYGHHFAILNQNTPILYGYKFQAMGVRIIFIISGYLITKSLWNSKKSRGKTALTYAIKRIGRIYPEYLVCILVTALVIAPVFTTLSQTEYWGNKSAIWMYISYNLRLFPIFWLPGMFEGHPYPNVTNGSLWTLPIEMAIYLLLLLIYLSSKKEKIRKYVYIFVTVSILVFLIVCINVLKVYSFVAYGTNWIQFLYLVPYYLIGGMAYLFDWRKYLNISAGTLLLLILGCNDAVCTGLMKEFVGYFSLSYLVLSITLEEKQSLSQKWIKGEYAYGIYLYGFVVQQCVVQLYFLEREVTMINFHVSFFVCVVITYVIAMVSYEWIYKLAQKGLEKILKRI